MKIFFVNLLKSFLDIFMDFESFVDFFSIMGDNSKELYFVNFFQFGFENKANLLLIIDEGSQVSFISIIYIHKPTLHAVQRLETLKVCLFALHPELFPMSGNDIVTLRNASSYEGINYETIFIFFSVVEIIAGSLLNGFVVFILFFNHRLLEIPANVVLLSLTISDFFVCSIILPYHVYEILHLRETVVHQALLLFSMTLGMFGIVLLTADRFFAIIWPLRYNAVVTLRRTRFVLVANWIISLLHSVTFFVAMRYKIKGVRYFISLVNFIAVLAIFVLYGVIFRAACRQIKMIHDRSQALRSVGFVVFRRTLKSAKTSGSIVFLFTVTYLPVCINSIVHARRKVPVSLFNERTAWLMALVFLNCTVNPLLYCAFSRNLRAVIRNTLRCVWSRIRCHSFVDHRGSNRVSSFLQNEQRSVEMSSAFSIMSIDKSL
jgi:hypothetical protein